MTDVELASLRQVLLRACGEELGFEGPVGVTSVFHVKHKIDTRNSCST